MSHQHLNTEFLKNIKDKIEDLRTKLLYASDVNKFDTKPLKIELLDYVKSTVAKSREMTRLNEKEGCVITREIEELLAKRDQLKNSQAFARSSQEILQRKATDTSNLTIYRTTKMKNYHQKLFTLKSKSEEYEKNINSLNKNYEFIKLDCTQKLDNIDKDIENIGSKIDKLHAIIKEFHESQTELRNKEKQVSKKGRKINPDIAKKTRESPFTKVKVLLDNEEVFMKQQDEQNIKQIMDYKRQIPLESNESAINFSRQLKTAKSTLRMQNSMYNSSNFFRYRVDPNKTLTQDTSFSRYGTEARFNRNESLISVDLNNNNNNNNSVNSHDLNYSMYNSLGEFNPNKSSSSLNIVKNRDRNYPSTKEIYKKKIDLCYMEHVERQDMEDMMINMGLNKLCFEWQNDATSKGQQSELKNMYDKARTTIKDPEKYDNEFLSILNSIGEPEKEINLLRKSESLVDYDNLRMSKEDLSKSFELYKLNV